MTTHSNSSDFMAPDQIATPVLMWPNVVEHYWGYTIATNELDIGLAVLVALCRLS